MTISDETRERIEKELKNWYNPNSEARKRFEAYKEYWDRVFYPMEQAIAESERLTERDYKFRINL